MTSPIGHPDYQTYANWRGPIVAFLSFSIVQNIARNFQFVATNYASLHVKASLSVGTGVTISITFFTDNTLTQAAGQYQYILNANANNVDVVVPVLSNVCQLQFLTVQPSGATCTVAADLMNILVTKPVHQGPPLIETGFQVSIPAATTDTFVTTWVREGAGNLFIAPDTGAGQYSMSLAVTTESGSTLCLILQAATQTAAINLPFVGQNAPLTLSIRNNAGAAALYDFAVSIAA